MEKPTNVRVAKLIEPDESLPPDLLALKRFATLMDAAFAIPGTTRRFGVDAIIGLIPWVGDAIGACFSTWIVVGALRHRVPFRYIVRMMVNIGIDLFIGAIPVAGDLFDMMFDENITNLNLLLKHRNRQKPPRSTRAIAFSVTALLFVLLLMIVSVAVLVIWSLVRLAEGR